MKMKKKYSLFALLAITILTIWTLPAYALNFEFGTLDFNDFDSWSLGYINVVNTTGSAGSDIIPGVDFINGRLTFTLATDSSGSNLANYVLQLSSNNSDYGVYDSLTGMNYNSYDSSSNTYMDGENVSAISPGGSLINLVDQYTTQTLIPYMDWDTNSYDLYIKDIKFMAQVVLDNFSTIKNGTTYYYDGTLDISAELFDDWFKISNIAGQPGSSAVITGDIPQGQPPAPVPEPSTFLLVAAGLCGLMLKSTRKAGINIKRQ